MARDFHVRKTAHQTIDVDGTTVVETMERKKPVVAIAKANDSTPIMSIIQQVATNPDAGIDKMKRLMQMDV